MVQCSEDRDPDDIEDLEDMLEWHAMQVRVVLLIIILRCAAAIICLLHAPLPTYTLVLVNILFFSRQKTCYQKYNSLNT